jgi:hypothetical protein
MSKNFIESAPLSLRDISPKGAKILLLKQLLPPFRGAGGRTQIAKLRVMKPLNPIFHRDPGQCQISDKDDFGLRIVDCGLKIRIKNPYSDYRSWIKKSKIINPKSEIIIMK